jgi:hypothetical protein
MVNRDHMIAYLLNEMPEEDRTAFVERWFTDPELYQQLQMVEAGLLDEYIRGGLSSRQRQQVEQFLLGSDIQLRKAEFAAALRAALPSPRRVRLPWTSIAAAVFLASTGLSLWLGLQNRKLQGEVVSMEHSVPSAAGGVYTLDLPSDTVRGESAQRTVRLASGISVLKLELELRPGDESQTYSAIISAGGRTVWSEAPLRAEATGADYLARVWIPAGILAPGDYTVRLESSGNPVAFYRFALVR